jgi:ribosomal protein S18 acetylase RimI-like enzyme
VTGNSTDAAERAAHINAYLRIVAAQNRDALRIGPFLALFDKTSDNPHLNYAIPDDGARGSRPDLERLVAAFRERGRRCRFEFAPQAAPALEADLAALGFEVEMRPPVMTCRAGQVLTPPGPEGFEVRLTADPDELRAVAQVLDAAYAEHGFSGIEDRDRLIGFVGRGGVVAVAATGAGEVAGAGMFTPIADGLTEVAGIGVAPRFRRRGLAAALTAALAREAFARGCTLAWLTPGGPTAQGAYERAGFKAGSEMLMMNLPLARQRLGEGDRP